ncbi:MAG TPA: O-antigen ligase family protein, partial [Solirubrobacteraceae bacterium]|jgi:O-antigen ligase|nr:O-antigen ligase family protein [Solirubrobacteraceae bacterium]
VFPRYIISADSLTPVRQAGGPFRAPISDGFACFACGVAAAIAWSRWRGRGRAFAGVTVGLCALGTFCSLERGVWLAAAAGALAAGMAAPELRRRVLPAFVVVAVLIGGALLAFPSLSGHASERAADKTPVWDRQNQTHTAFRMIAAYPLFGVGWDDYVHRSTDFFRQAPNIPMTGFSTSQNPLPLHDSYLSNGVELGLVGLTMWVCSLLWGLGGAVLAAGPPDLRAWKLGLLAIAVFFCVLAFFDPLQQNFSELLLWTWAGLCMSGAGAFGVARGAESQLAPRWEQLLEGGSAR